MAKDKIPPEILAHFAMWDEIHGETDRGAAILAHAYLDHTLREAIESLFVNKQRTAKGMLETGALGTFAAKAQLLYCLGFFGPNILQDLNKINDVRNLFAHKHDPISFTRADVQALCKALNYEYHVGRKPDPYGPKERYLQAVSVIANIIHHETIREDRVYQAPAAIWSE